MNIYAIFIHDLKNLATSLNLVFNNAKDYIGDPEFQRDMLDTINATAAKMKSIINKLKGIPEKRPLHMGLTDIDHLTRRVLSNVNGIGNRANILYAGSQALSMVDSEEIEKVVLNLVLNAIDAVDKKGKIQIETGTEGAFAYVKVSDEGCGMERDFIDSQLFRPFRTMKKKGLGVGLCQCKQIISAHGGRIDVESSPGESSVFTVYLPSFV